MFLILVASNAMDGTLQGYRPPFFVRWAIGAWARGSWGMNDEFALTGGGSANALQDYTQRRRRRGWV